jgi:hypothetical protein
MSEEPSLGHEERGSYCAVGVDMDPFCCDQLIVDLLCFFFVWFDPSGNT